MSKIAVLRFLIFYSIALLLSNLFRFDVFELNQQLSGLPLWPSIMLKTVLEGSGVFIGALIGIALLKKERSPKITFSGHLKYWNIIMVLIGITAVAVVGVANDFGLNRHIYGLLAVIATFAYCIMEEYGWRGYLQNELSSLKPMAKYVIIGILWYLWHLTFLKGGSVQENLFFMGLLIFGSWGIGQIAEATKSIVASACFHLIVQIMSFNALIKDGLTGTEKWILLGICVVLWVLIIKNWEKGTKRDKSKIST